MNAVGYLSKELSIPDAIDELVRTREDRDAALREFDGANRDGALAVDDRNALPSHPHQVRAKIERVVSGLMNWQITRQSELTYELIYLRSVYLSRRNFERIFGIQELQSGNSDSSPDAPERLIRDEIRSVYQEARTSARKPPNIKELPPLVKQRIESKGYAVTKARIETIGGEAEFGAFRGPVGKRIT